MTSDESWHRGYFADTGYTHGYFREMAPSYLAWAALMQGVAVPTRDFRYVDLGCGQGFGLILLAACHPDSQFIGVDFMPAHVAHARQLAQDGGVDNVTFIEGDFVSLAASPESLRDATGVLLDGAVDYVVAHGIAAWVAPEVRTGLWRLAGRLLRPGGLHYTSYNVMAGWAGLQPFQRLVLLRHHRGLAGTAAVEQTLETYARLEKAKARTFAVYPALASRLETARKQDMAYLTQEYSNECWQPQHVADMMAQAAAVKLEWLGTATLPEVFEALMPAEIQALIAEERDPVLRESLRDIALCQAFRRDLYVKGRAPLWTAERTRRVEQVRLVASPFNRLPSPESQGNKDRIGVDIGIGRVQMDRGRCMEVLHHVGTAGLTVGELHRALAKGALPDTVQLVTMMLFSGWLTLHKDTAAGAASLNRAIIRAVCSGAPYRHLAVPLHDEAAALDGVKALIALACIQCLEAGKQAPALSDVQQRLRPLRLGHDIQLRRNDVTLTEGPEYEKEWQRRIEYFLREDWPHYRRLNMV
ncbi:MAG: class I SAM-dependent methyltransferase [Comamonadaceae bacterium]|uniref:class I SAM-dependent methyltransferase n=1 Tax=Candidatus Skiveiella danica TaxID=3386177 RepID=UPI00390C165F|nr:class I SAM-dependent methyltransferase [Comamonadaceae bacterium]